MSGTTFHKDCACKLSLLASEGSGASSLESALEAEGRHYGDTRTGEGRECLLHAYRVLKPITHTEFALVVWAGFSGNPYRRELLDEYCRRREGKKPGMFDHPILHIDRIPAIDTCGVLIFREHMDMIARCVFGLRSGMDIYREQDLAKVLAVVRTADNKLTADLSDAELMGCLQLIHANYGPSLPYYYCMAIVESAWKSLAGN